MSYKKILFFIICIFLTNCTAENLINNQPEFFSIDNNHKNKGFALIYSDVLYEDKIITQKINERDLMIFQKNLKRNTQVKITNILNNKSLIAKVGKKSNYPSFNNSVISIRIASELDLDINEPYVEILEIPKNSLFVAKKAKTYEEEKNVANKAPVNSISINNLNKVKTDNKKVSKNEFSYIIKIADFYFKDTARVMLKRITDDTKIKNPKIKKISNKNYRVYLGPFSSINSLQKSFNDINILKFENIEIIKND